LLAGQVIVVPEDDALYARGTADADLITVQRVGFDDVFIRVNDVSGTFDMDDFSRIVLLGREGGDTINILSDFEPVSVFADAGAGNDTVRGGAGPNQMEGGDGDDSIVGGGDFDSINAGAGNDTISAGGGVDWVFGGEGKDSILGGSGNDLLSGDAGPDVIRGEAGDDTLAGGDSNDFSADALFGGDGRDSIVGGPGDDFMDGGNGDDWMQGLEGNDTLLGGADDDFLDGDGGNADSLVGGSGRNAFLRGELGFTEPTSAAAFIGQSDRLVVVGTSGAEFMNVQPSGFDDVRITINGVVFTFDTDDFTDLYLVGHAHNDSIYVAGAYPVTIEGGAGNDRLTGGERADGINGDTGDDTISGGGGNDLLAGGFGRDQIFGDNDNDTLFSSGDNVADTLFGGPGDDDHAFVDAIDQHTDVENVVIQP
jgi:Ca2+-binding RTX toxin-like protein